MFIVVKQYDPAVGDRESRYELPDVLTCLDGSTYQLLSFLGKGGNGAIYSCVKENGGTQPTRALKILRQTDAMRTQRFDFEVDVLQGIQHRNILSCYTVGECRLAPTLHLPFMVTDLMQSTLHRKVEYDGVRQPSEIVSYADGLCDGLTELHRLGIIHRDIKPANLFLRDNEVVIGDLGLAKTVSDEGELRFPRADLTRDSETVGPHYAMSPELLDYADDKTTLVDERSDLFQVGYVLWYLATGRPIVGMLSPRADPTGGPLFEVVSRCIQYDRDDRPSSAEELKTLIHTQFGI